MIWLVVTVFGVSAFLTQYLRKYMLAKGMMDIPNTRSSHVIPTPRGGGLAFVAAFLAGVVFLFLFAGLPLSIMSVFVFVGGLVAAVGFWDDLNHLSAKTRITVHIVAAVSGLYFLRGIDSGVVWGGLSVELLINTLAILLIVWMLNLFNFMDGIDGIAGSETVFIALGISTVVYSNNDAESLFWICLILAASVSGFLIYNWPPAKVFMGDVGSGFLGFIIGLILIWAIKNDSMSLATGVIFIAVFFVDASFTLIRRMLTRQKWYEAHCSHAYQYAARRWPHKVVTLTVILINTFFLFPLVWLSVVYPDFEWFFVAIAYLPLVGLAQKFRAGLPYGRIS